jgi:hypothetical protein
VRRVSAWLYSSTFVERRRAMHSRLAAITTFAALVAAIVAGAAVAGSSESDRRGGALRPASDFPGLAQAQDAADKRAARRRAKLRRPEARAKRRRSRTAFKNLGRAAALRLARRSFDDVFAQPVWRGLAPGHGQRVRRYLDDFSAELEDAAGTRSVATSTLPLRTRDAAGRAVPVDLGLAPRGDALAPQAPLVETRIGRRARSGVALGRGGLRVRPVGAADVAGTLVNDRLFYPDVNGADADTDLLIEPRDTGAELMWQLRSAAAPDQHALALDLPPGAKLRASARVPGAAEVVRGEQLIAFISPPSAVDADGSPVRTSYEVAGDTLDVNVAHRAADVRYPLLVDPEFNVIEDFFDPNWTGDPSDGGFSGWSPGYRGPAATLQEVFNAANYGWALHISAKPWVGYRAYDFAEFLWTARKHSYIYRADFLHMTYTARTWSGSSEAKSCLLVGLYATRVPDVWENNGTAHRWDPNWHFCNTDRSNYIQSGICSSSNCNPGVGTDGNAAVFAFYAVHPGEGNSGFAGVSRVVLYLRDRHPPKVLSTNHSQNLTDAINQGQWLPGGVGVSTTPRATDWGLGLARLELINRLTERKIPGYSAGSNPRYLWCSFSSSAHDTTPDANGFIDAGADKGDRNHGCQAASTPPGTTAPDNETVAQTFDYSTDQLDEGIHTYGVDAYDIVGIKNDPPTSGWTVKVDRTPPEIYSVQGSLWDRRNQPTDHRREGVYEPTYTLSASARDGVPGASRSGLASIEIQVDGDTKFTWTASCAGQDNCSDTSAPWTFNSDDYTDGDHTITVIAKDALATEPGVVASDHTATQSFTVTVDRRGDIYNATHYEADPATGVPLIAEEWARAGTTTGRSVDSESITTRHAPPCDLDDQYGPTCGEIRMRSRYSESSPTEGDTWTVYRGTSANDHRLEPATEIAQAIELGSSVSPTERGPIEDALAPWQNPPPAAGTEYELYEMTETVDESEPADPPDGGEEEQVTSNRTLTFRLWIDRTTRMALKASVRGPSGEDYGTVYYKYSKGRLEDEQVPDDFFSVERPSHVDHEKTVQFRDDQAIGQTTDQEGATFYPYYVGPQITLPSGVYCLGTGMTIRMNEPGTDTITEPEANVDDTYPEETTLGPPDPLGPDTTVEVTYERLAPGTTCVPGIGDLQGPPMIVRSTSSASSTAAAWRRSYQETGTAIQMDPLHEDFLRGGVQPVFVGASSNTAYIVRVDDDTSAALIETGGTAIIVVGQFDRGSIGMVAAELEVR